MPGSVEGTPLVVARAERECTVCNEWVIDCAHFGGLAVQYARVSGGTFLCVHGPGTPGGPHNWACSDDPEDDCPVYDQTWGDEARQGRAEFERRCEQMRAAL